MPTVIRGLRATLATAATGEGGTVFALFGLPLRVHPFFWLTLLVLGWRSHAPLGIGGLAVWLAVAASSVLLHELGHATVARRYGVVLGIHLHGAGGVTHWRPLGTAHWWKRAAVIAGGPAAGALLALGSWPFVGVRPGTNLGLAVFDIFYINAAWTVFNLLPAEPLDGGQLLRVVVERGGRARDGVVAAVGLAVAVLGALAALVAVQPWTLLTFFFCGVYNLERLTRHRDEQRRTAWERRSEGERVRDRY